MPFQPSINVTSLDDVSEEEWVAIANEFHDFPEKLLKEYPTKKSIFLDDNETRVLKILRFQFKREDKYEVFSQVHMIRLLDVDNSDVVNLAKKYVTFFQGEDPRYALLNEISMMSHDFVIANDDGVPLCVIEIDGDSHKKWRRMFLDKLKNQCLENAGIKIVRIKTDEFNKGKVFPVKRIDEIREICIAENKIAQEEKKQREKIKKENKKEKQARK